MRNRRIRRTAVLLVLLTAVVLFATGLAGSSVAALKDLTDTARIAFLPGAGWPQQTGVAGAGPRCSPLTGSFVELGNEGCVVWSHTGKKLNSIQSGYARPALAAGKTRFVLYNRSGNELRVESRPRISTPSRWKTASSSAPCPTTAHWRWSPRTRPVWRSFWFIILRWSSSSAGA